MRYLAFILFSFISLNSLNAHAGGLGSALSKLGSMSNVNKPGVMSDQLGGFATGGSIHTRNPVADINLLNIQPPSLDMGCGGIDLFLGGMGYINSERLVNFIKTIGSNALSYGAQLAIKTVSPEISDLLSQLETMARSLNAQNINSCQMGASIASGLWTKNAASQDLACQARKMGENKIGDYFTSRYNCSNSDKAEINKEEYKGILGTEFNLVWRALKGSKDQDGNISQKEKEDLMSISGTLISTPDKSDEKKGAVKFTHKSSLINRPELLQQLLYGNQHKELKRYKCKDKDDKCIEMQVEEMDFDKEDIYMVKVRKLVESIAAKFYDNGTNFTADEENLIETTSIPILKIIKMETVLKGKNMNLSVDEYVELIAFDYLISYLNKMIDEVYRAVAALEYNQIDGEPIKNFKDEIREVKAFLSTERMSVFERMNTLLSVKQRIAHTENMLNSVFADFRD